MDSSHQLNKQAIRQRWAGSLHTGGLFLLAGPWWLFFPTQSEAAYCPGPHPKPISPPLPSREHLLSSALPFQGPPSHPPSKNSPPSLPSGTTLFFPSLYHPLPPSRDHPLPSPPLPPPSTTPSPVCHRPPHPSPPLRLAVSSLPEISELRLETCGWRPAWRVASPPVRCRCPSPKASQPRPARKIPLLPGPVTMAGFSQCGGDTRCARL
ncbi:proline-rich receptor-like protein kinase PERK9 [Dromiciops gliroides]|uniref:proline-rich receptor-like protein kinase PERK9 n=1 Tax=Dromiciops gliroides TaxID=33562 RepID=UPI001CC777EF|nr:proline-rich receptor-like protein kinase PERK9 [Dromiciops gliroides]